MKEKTNIIPFEKEAPPVLALKNVKVHLGLSQETFAFTASLWVDGKRYAAVSNAGHGGPCEIHEQKGAQSAAELDQRISSTFPRLFSDLFPKGREQDLDEVISGLVSRHLLVKEIKSNFRKCFVALSKEDEKIYQWKKVRGESEEAGKARWKASNGEKYTLLNDLPLEEVVALHKKHG